MAADVLADGKPHLRRELVAALRSAGLKTGNVDNALRAHNDFVWWKDQEDRAVYAVDEAALDAADQRAGVDYENGDVAEQTRRRQEGLRAELNGAGGAPE